MDENKWLITRIMGWVVYVVLWVIFALIGLFMSGFWGAILGSAIAGLLIGFLRDRASQSIAKASTAHELDEAKNKLFVIRFIALAVIVGLGFYISKSTNNKPKQPQQSATQTTQSATAQTLSKEQLKQLATLVYNDTSAALTEASRVSNMTDADAKYMETPKVSRMFSAAADKSNPLGMENGVSLGAMAEPYGRCSEYATSAQFLWSLIYSEWVDRTPDPRKEKDRVDWANRTTEAGKNCRQQIIATP